MAGRAGACIAATIVLALAAAAAVGAAPAPGTPDLSTLTLQVGDLPSMKEAQAISFDHPSGVAAAEYERVLVTTRNTARFAFVASAVLLTGSDSAEAQVYTQAVRSLRPAAARTAVAALVRAIHGAQVAQHAQIKMSKLVRVPSLGDGAQWVHASYRVGRGHAHAALVAFRVGFVVGIDIFLGNGARVSAGEVASVARIGEKRVEQALVPIAISPPVVTGSAVQGQTLTASPGSWGDAPTGYAYQWQRCDPTGQQCADVAGATANTYLVGDADAGATLRVDVTATNRFGSATGPSAVTAAVS